MRPATFPHSAALKLLFAFACCFIAVGALTMQATTAHALFSSQVRSATSHAVKAFPISLTVETSADEMRSEQIDRDQLTVNVAYSDGTVRTLGNDDYELSPSGLEAGFRGDFEGEAIYREAGHEVSGGFALTVDGAYGAQYGDVLVFGRGLPARTYEGKPLANVTWGIETAAVAVQWNRAQLVKVIDAATVSPVSMASWFSGATALAQVELDDIDTSRVSSFYNTFLNCSKLTSLPCVSDWDTSNAISFAAAFQRMSALVSLDLSRWDVSKGSDFCGMFSQDANLTSVGDISNWNMSHARSIDVMFQNCSKINGLGNLGKWNTASLQRMGNTFQCCFALTGVGDLSGWNTSNVTWMMETFQQCSSLETVGDISRWNTANVTSMYQMMQLCPKFKGCKSGAGYRTLDLSSWNVSKVADHTSFCGSTPGVSEPNWR